MKFVLVVVLAAAGGSGMSQWGQPAITSATFNTEAACVAAALKLKALEGRRGTEGLDFVRVTTICLPEG